MITLMIVLSLAFGAWWISKNYGQLKSRAKPQLARQAGGVLALVVAAILGFRGRLDMALLVGSGGAWLLGWDALWGFLRGGQPLPPGPAAASPAAPAVRTVQVEVDPRTGRLAGRVLGGPFAGRALDALAEPELLALRGECLGCDPESLRLVEAYLDSRSPAWREHAEADRDARGGPDLERPAMSQQEAYQVLGLEPGASAEEIRRAHRALLMKLHPDQGGSTYLASRVNQAKDALLDRHR